MGAGKRKSRPLGGRLVWGVGGDWMMGEAGDRGCEVVCGKWQIIAAGVLVALEEWGHEFSGLVVYLQCHMAVIGQRI